MEQPRRDNENLEQQKEMALKQFQEAVALLSAEKLRAFAAVHDQIEAVPIVRQDGTVFYIFRKKECVFLH